jgi:hypothetical protein
MKLVSMLEPRGYGFGDSMYCRIQSEMELVENNAKIYELLLHFDSTKVLNLTAKRGVHGVDKKLKKTKQGSTSGDNCSSIITYSSPIVLDFSEPPVYAVDEDGQLFNSQVGSNNPVGQGSHNQAQFYDVDEDVELSASDEDADVGTHDAAFDMGDLADSVEIRMKEKAEADEILEEMRKQKEDPMSHCQGDTDTKDLFVSADEPGVEPLLRCH